ncbi:MAG TPA: hypothetical protein VIQ60_07455, partial [Gemmatimonadaceae bacterium]
MSERRAALIALAASLVLYLLVLALFPGTGDEDAAIHAIFARFPTPERVLTIWSRPLFAALYLIPAWLGGYLAMRITTVAICAATAWLTYLVARRAGLRRAWIAIPLVLLQPPFLQVGTDTMTEPIFALVLAIGFLALAHHRPLMAAAALSFLPLARPEGPFILLVLAAIWLPAVRRNRRYLLAICLLGLGMAVWALACIVVTGNAGYLRSLPWPTRTPQVTTVFTSEAFTHYLARWPHIVGLGLLPLWLIGLRPSWRHPLLRFCVLITLALVAVHTLLYAAGTMGSLGFDRYLTTIAPAIALVATAGALALAARLANKRRAATLLGALLALEVLHATVAFDSNPFNYLPRATLEAARQARARFHPAGRPLIAADQFAYVFLDNAWGRDRLPATSHDVTAATIAGFPAGTLVVWDDLTGDWWYHLSVEDFTARGYRLLWERRTTLASPLAPLYERARLSSLDWFYNWIGVPPARELRQAVLIRE